MGIKEDSHSPYGLGFKKRNSFDFFEAPELGYENNRKKFKILDERGMPIFDENGVRTLYTRSDGLSRLYLGRDLDLFSDWDGLSGSDEYGRVVVVKPAKPVRKNR